MNSMLSQLKDEIARAIYDGLRHRTWLAWDNLPEPARKNWYQSAQNVIALLSKSQPAPVADGTGQQVQDLHKLDSEPTWRPEG
jgi:hypothetical protein